MLQIINFTVYCSKSKFKNILDLALSQKSAYIGKLNEYGLRGDILKVELVVTSDYDQNLLVDLFASQDIKIVIGNEPIETK